MEDVQTPPENQSDSDSSESWTFVDKNASKMESEYPEVSSSCEENAIKRTIKEPEEDTDGVVVITDDEEVSSTQDSAAIQEPPPIYTSTQFIPLQSPEFKKPLDFETSSTGTYRDSEEELPSDFYIANRKIKSYVHKRNNHVSNLLNFVLVGALIIATTLAVGFTWGINDDTCTLNVLDSVNDILANLQKLQRENELLKSKIRILRTMKYNKPIEKDVDFDKYLDYHMHLEQQRMIPKYDETQNLINNLDKISDYQIIVDREPELNNKEAADLLESRFLQGAQINNTASLNTNNINEENFDFSQKKKPRSNVEKLIQVGNTNNYVEKDQLKQRIKREETVFNNNKHSSKSSKTKSFCDDASNSNHKEYIKKCNHNKAQPKLNAKKEEIKYKTKNYDDNYKSLDEIAEKYKADKQGTKKYKKPIEIKDKSKVKDVKNNRKFKPVETTNNGYEIPKNQEYDNVSDWYQKRYNGRQEIRDKGYDDYDMLDIKNKAKWYFKRMNDREKIRWKGGERYNKRQQIRKGFMKNRF